MISYIVVFAITFVVGIIVLQAASRAKNHQKMGWTISWPSWVLYALVFGFAGTRFGLNPVLSGLVAAAGGFLGTIFGFIFAMCTSKRNTW